MMHYLKYLLLFSHSVLSDSLRPHGLQHTRPPCPSPSPGVCSNSCPLSRWCHSTISSSVIPFSSWFLSFPASGSFFNELALHIRQPKYWSCISPSNEYSELVSFRIAWFDLLAVQGTLKNLLQHHSSKASVLHCSAIFIVQLLHPHMTTGKTIISVQFSCSVVSNSLQPREPDLLHIRWQSIGKTITLTIWTFVGNVMSLLFNTLSRFVITFLPRSKRLLISCSLKHSPLEIMECHCIEYCDLFWIFHIFFPTLTTKVLSVLPQISTPPLIRYQMCHVIMPEKLKYSYISVLGCA